jgi:hypothetical protein
MHTLLVLEVHDTPPQLRPAHNANMFSSLLFPFYLYLTPSNVDSTLPSTQEKHTIDFLRKARSRAQPRRRL